MFEGCLKEKGGGGFVWDELVKHDFAADSGSHGVRPVMVWLYRLAKYFVDHLGIAEIVLVELYWFSTWLFLHFATVIIHQRPATMDTKNNCSGCICQDIDSEQQCRSVRISRRLDKLATVELQLVLQFLDTCNKLKTARCNRRLLQVVGHPFAWRYASPFIVTLRTLADLPPQPSLLRLIPLSLWIKHPYMPSDLDCLRKPPVNMVVRELHIDHAYIQCDEWSQLLLLPALQSLQLICTRTVIIPTHAVAHMAILPQLRSLSIQNGEGVGETLVSLMSAPSLTHISVTLRIGTAELRGMQSISQCLQLRSLKLTGQNGYVFGFQHLFIIPPSPQQQLERIYLEGFLAQPNLNWHQIPVPTAEEMRNGLAAMFHLTELQLKRIYSLDSLLACLHVAPKLRVLELKLTAQHPSAISFSGSTHPSAGTVRALLTLAPQLEVRLLLTSSIDKWMEDMKGENVRVRMKMAEQWNQLRCDFNAVPRVTTIYE